MSTVRLRMRRWAIRTRMAPVRIDVREWLVMLACVVAVLSASVPVVLLPAIRNVYGVDGVSPVTV